MNRRFGGLRLEVSLREEDGPDWGANTYRNEGVSINTRAMRLFGEEVPMEVSYDELNMGERIGAGACSSVHVATHIQTGAKYAVKMFNAFDSSQTSQLRKELIALVKVDCESIVRIQGAWHKDSRIGLIIEYMDLGSLDVLCSRRCQAAPLPERVLAAIAFQILWGLCYLHYGGKLHRDIKPANILFSSSGGVKISDFGISSIVSGSVALSHTSVGTFKYMSPERLLGDSYDATSDVWSLGLTLVELVVRRYPLERCATTPIDLVSELETLDVPSWLCSLGDEGTGAGFSPLLRDFIASMLQADPALRPSSEALLHESPWLTHHLGAALEEDEDGGLGACREIVRKWADIHNIAAGAGSAKSSSSAAAVVGAAVGKGRKEDLGLSHSGNPSPPKKNRAPEAGGEEEEEDEDDKAFQNFINEAEEEPPIHAEGKKSPNFRAAGGYKGASFSDDEDEDYAKHAKK